jgi:hypothetical protein
MKIKELIFALVQKSEGRVGKLLETRELYFGRISKSAEGIENNSVGTFGLAKEFAGC